VPALFSQLPGNVVALQSEAGRLFDGLKAHLGNLQNRAGTASSRPDFGDIGQVSPTPTPHRTASRSAEPSGSPVVAPSPIFSSQTISALQQMLPTAGVQHALRTTGVSIQKSPAKLDTLPAQVAQYNKLVELKTSSDQWQALSRFLAPELVAVDQALKGQVLRSAKEATQLMNQAERLLHGGASLTAAQRASVQTTERKLAALEKQITTAYGALYAAGLYQQPRHPVAEQIQTWRNTVDDKLLRVGYASQQRGPAVPPTAPQAPTLQAQLEGALPALGRWGQALQQLGQLPADVTVAQRQEAMQTLQRASTVLQQTLSQPQILALLHRSAAAAAPGGAPQPPQDERLMTMLLNGFANALGSSVMDAVQGMLGDPVSADKAQRGALIAFVLGLALPDGARLLQRMALNGVAGGGETALRQLAGLDPRDPTAIALNTALSAGGGAVAELIFRALARAVRGPTPAIEGGNPAMMMSHADESRSANRLPSERGGGASPPSERRSSTVQPVARAQPGVDPELDSSRFPAELDPRQPLPASWGDLALLELPVGEGASKASNATQYFPPSPGSAQIGRALMTDSGVAKHIDEAQTLLRAGLDPGRYGLGIVAFAQRADGKFDVAVQHVDGVSLDALSLTAEQRREVGRRLLDEIQLLRAHGLQPTDLKAEHVLVRLRNDGSVDRVRLIDPYLFDVRYAKEWTPEDEPFISALLEQGTRAGPDARSLPGDRPLATRGAGGNSGQEKSEAIPIQDLHWFANKLEMDQSAVREADLKHLGELIDESVFNLRKFDTLPPSLREGVANIERKGNKRVVLSVDQQVAAINNVSPKLGEFIRDSYLHELTSLERKNWTIQFVVGPGQSRGVDVKGRNIFLKLSDSYSSLSNQRRLGVGAELETAVQTARAVDSYRVSNSSDVEAIRPKKTIKESTLMLSEEERSVYKLTVRDGRLYDASGRPFDTSSTANMRSGQGFATFVMDTNRNIYAGLPDVVELSGGGGTRAGHHTSYVAGSSVLLPGEIRTAADGTVLELTNYSGHYQPTPSQFLDGMTLMQQQGLNLDRTLIRLRSDFSFPGVAL
jgi:hypothetical protein